MKPYEASEAETNLFVSISEPIKVGHEVSKHNRTESRKNKLVYFYDRGEECSACKASANMVDLNLDNLKIINQQNEVAKRI